ncbi:MAG: hypothetical protein AB4206_09695 [Xenococcaceae cyanobacterium]
MRSTHLVGDGSRSLYLLFVELSDLLAILSFFFRVTGFPTFLDIRILGKISYLSVAC